MPRIVRTPAAEHDIAQILDWIALGSYDAAINWFDDLSNEFDLLLRFSKIGEAVDNLHPGLRRITFSGYLIFYRQINDDIEVVRVLHGSRDMDRLFE